MANYDMIMERNKYYGDIRVMFEIVKNLVGRESVFLSKTECWRCLKIHKVEFFNKNAQFCNFYREPFNIYYSLARLENMPMFTYSKYDRKAQQNKFTQEFKNYMVGFDLGMDFDGHNLPFKTVYEDTMKVKQFFEEYKIAYELKCSGSGFHINVNHLKMPNLPDKAVYFKQMVDKIKTIFNLKSLDLGVYDERRIWKCPYSYDVKSGNIALPLTDAQFDKFSFDMVRPDEVLKLNLVGRGNLERPGTISGFSQFLKEFIDDEEENVKND